MRYVYCKIVGDVLDILDFQKLPENIIELYRRELTCEHCGADAFYRKRSKDGKAACFGARHINEPEKCEAATETRPYGKEEEKDIETVDRILASENELELSFENNVRTLVNTYSENTKTPSTFGRTSSTITRSHSSSASPNVRTPSVGLKKTLNNLLYSPKFRDSSDVIHIHGYSRQIRNFNIELKGATPSDKPYLFWGMISHASDDLSWLNVGGSRDASILIDPVKEELISIINTDDPEDFSGALVIVYGWCSQSKNTGKIFIKPANDDLQHIFIKLA